MPSILSGEIKTALKFLCQHVQKERNQMQMRLIVKL